MSPPNAPSSARSSPKPACSNASPRSSSRPTSSTPATACSSSPRSTSGTAVRSSIPSPSPPSWARRGWIDEVGGQPYITNLVTELPTTVGAEHYARVVQRAATYRDMLRAAAEIGELAYRADPNVDTSALRGDGEALLRSAAQSSARTSPSCRTCSATCCRTRSTSMAASSRPCAPGSAISIGCSTAACTPPTWWCSRPDPPSASLPWRSPSPATSRSGQSATVAMFSLEMSAEQVAGRLVSAESRR